VVRFLPFLISLVLSVYALFSCIQTRDEDVPYLPKLVWIVLIVFVPFVGPIVWLLMVRNGAARSERPVRRATTPSGRPVAPDDDPDFLASLERYRDPRTTIRPPAPTDRLPGDPVEGKPTPKDKPADPAPAEQAEAGDENAREAKDNKARGPESEAPSDSDDGKP
jgi:hypothetical protein